MANIRDSAYRNVYAEPWAPSTKYTDVKPNKGSNTLIKCNTIYFAVPWNAGGGALGVFPLGKAGKLNGNFLIRAHSSPITAFDFHPFVQSIVVTGSRDPGINVWSIPDGGLTADINEPIRSLSGHTKRISALCFHPTANNVLFSAGGDNVCKLWDINAGEASIELKGFEDAVTSVDWAFDSILATAAKQKLLIFDPRAKTEPIASQIPHESAKGFELVWLSGVGAGGGAEAAYNSKKQLLATVGWSKASERQLAVWDSRKLVEPLSVQVIDVSSSQLSPFFDCDTGLLYLVEKGTRTYAYEMVGAEPYAHLVCKYDGKISQFGAAMVPKRMYNVMNCEVARFLMIGNDVIETVSFYVPRKDKSLFQEDIYPPALAGKAALSASEWFAKKNAAPVVMSLKPAGVQSVYDVSEVEGGRSRAKDKQRAAAVAGAPIATPQQMGPLTEGNLFLGNEGWVFTSWMPAYAIIKEEQTFYVFENKDAAVPLHSFALDTLVTLRPSSDNDYIFEIQALGAKIVKLKCTTTAERDAWIDSLNEFRRKLAAKKVEAARIAEAQQLANADLGASGSAEESKSTTASTSLHLEGPLLKYTEGFFYNYWNKAYFRVVDNVLYSYPSETAAQSTEQVLLEKVMSVYEASNIENAPFCFKIATATRTWMLRAANEQELKMWVNGLSSLVNNIKKAVAKEEDDDAVQAIINSNQTVVEGFLSVKTGLWSLWSKTWVTVIGGDILLSKQPMAQPHNRLQIAKAQLLDISDRDVEQAFMLRYPDGTTYHFLAPTRAIRDEWLASLTEIRQALNTSAIDVLGDLGINLAEIPKLNSRQIEDALKNVIDLNKVKQGAQPILIRIHGKRIVRACCVEPSVNSLYDDNVFLLDLGGVIYQWNGRKASRMLKAKGLDISTRIKQKERGGNCQVRTIEHGSDDEAVTFWKVLGGKKEITRTVPAEEVDKDLEPLKLYKVTDKKVALIHQGRPPSKDRLDSRFCFIVESATELFLWQGKNASRDSKKLSLKVIEKLQARKQTWHIVLRVIENGETSLWKEKFKDYPGELPISTTKPTIVSNISQKKEQKPIDIAAMHKGVPPPATKYDDGSGKLQVWRVLDFDKEPVPEELYGHFWSSCSYLLKYTYMEGNSEKVLLYFWQGRDSSTNEKGTSAYLTKELDEKIAGTGKQIRVPQDFEPEHFLLVFKNKFVIHAGEFDSNWLQNITNARMFDIRGESDITVHAKELPVASARSLHSGHAFVVITKDTTFVWQGNGATTHEIQFANSFAASTKRNVVQLKEGSESDAFWNAIGGKAEYYQPKVSIRPKLFVVSDATGAVEVTEIFDVVQDSLLPNNCMILDCGTAVYAWFGPGSSIPEQKYAMQTSKDYVSQAAQHGARISPTAPVYVTKMWQEPVEFKAAFQAWSDTRTPKDKTNLPVFSVPVDDVLKDYLREVYSYAELLADPLPVGVDATRLETYLTAEEFEKVFNITRQQYDALPKWKQDQLKKSVGLF